MDPETADRLARIEERLGFLVQALTDKLPGLEARLTKVERVMWLALGMATASGLPQVAQLLGS